MAFRQLGDQARYSGHDRSSARQVRQDGGQARHTGGQARSSRGQNAECQICSYKQIGKDRSKKAVSHKHFSSKQVRFFFQVWRRYQPPMPAQPVKVNTPLRSCPGSGSVCPTPLYTSSGLLGVPLSFMKETKFM